MEPQTEYLYIKTKDAFIKVEKQALRNSYVLTYVTDQGIGSAQNPLVLELNKKAFKKCLSPEAKRTYRYIQQTDKTMSIM